MFWLSVATRAAAIVPVEILEPFSEVNEAPEPLCAPLNVAAVAVPDTASDVNVPTEVIFGCAAVETVAA